MDYFFEHDLATVFGIVLLQQLGAPIPALPVLMFAGAGAIGHPLHALYALVLSIVASTIGNLAWFWAGRHYGYRVLDLLCRVSLSPDSCVGQSELKFERYGVLTLVFARFVPGLSFLAPPLAGALRFRTLRFVAYNAAGTALWSALGLLLGFVFHAEIDWLLDQLAALCGYALFVITMLIGLYVTYRWFDRRRFLRSLDAVRVGVDELEAMINRGDDPIILDVRSRTHRRIDGRTIPGARTLDLDDRADLRRTLADVPRDRDVVVYCACPNEATAAKVAMLLRDGGIVRVRPLKGGIEAWVTARLRIDNPIR